MKDDVVEDKRRLDSFEPRETFAGKVQIGSLNCPVFAGLVFGLTLA